MTLTKLSRANGGYEYANLEAVTLIEPAAEACHVYLSSGEVLSISLSDPTITALKSGADSAYGA